MLCGAVVLLCGAAPKAIAQTVWTTCTWDTSSIYKQKDGKEKFERRFYATDLIATTKEVYVALTKGVPGLEDVCGDYIQRNMSAAALWGRIVNVAYQAGMQASVNFAPMLMKRLSLLATTLRARSNAEKGAIRR